MEKSQIDGDTTPTAVQRTPAEVWQMALLIAVESPLRPRSGDDVIDVKMVFSTCCRSYDRFKRIEALRTQLRLVCQEWNAILKDLGHHFAFIKHGYLERVQLWGEESRKIRRIEAVRKCVECAADYYSRSKASDLDTYIVPLEDTQWVESLLVSNKCKTDTEYQFIMKVLDSSPRLRALEIQGFPGEYFTNILNHQALTRVTHLSIGLLGVGYEEQLCFPAVQHLRVTILPRRLNEALLDWRFPALRNFHLYLEYQFVDGDLPEGLDQFIALHGEQITSLLIDSVTADGTFDRQPYHSNKDFWRWFPNLRLLGPGMGALHCLTPPPTNSKLRSLAIQGRRIGGHFGKKFPFDMYLDNLLVICRMLRVKRLVMTDLWEDMTSGPAHRTNETSSWSSRLFEEAAAKGIQVFDSDRIPISDQKGERFLQELRDPIFSR